MYLSNYLMKIFTSVLLDRNGWTYALKNSKNIIVIMVAGWYYLYRALVTNGNDVTTATYMYRVYWAPF